MLILNACCETEPEYQQDPGSFSESIYTCTPAYLMHNFWLFVFFEDFQAILMYCWENT